MKKFSILLILVCLMFIVGCASGNYFQVPEDDQTADDEESELIKEIQEIEKQLQEVEDVDEDLDDKIILEEKCKEVCEESCEEVCTTDEDTDETTCEEVCEESCETVCEDEEAVDTTALQTIEVEETDLVNLKIESQDLDEDIVTYSFSQPLDENGQWQTTYGDHGEYVLDITASDGQTTTMKKLLLVVIKKNVPPEINELKASIEVDEGEKISLSPKISDPNKDDIEVVFSEPFNELGIWVTDHTSAGTYDVTVSASDGELIAEETVHVVVNDVNMLPEITNLEDVITVQEGETVTIAPEVTDLDNDAINVTISTPVGNDGVWETGYTDHGEYEITVIASDGKGKTEVSLTVIVEDINVPPEIIDIQLA